MLISHDSKARCWAIFVAANAIFTSAAAPSMAAPTTTKDMGDVADFLMQKATCADFSAALKNYDKPDQSAEEITLVILALMYVEGYAAGAGNDSGKRADVIIRCTMNPDQKFNTVVIK